MRKRYLVEILMFFSYMLFAMSWKTGDFLIKNLGFNASQLATMTNAINIAKIVGCLSAATIIFKFGKKKTFLLSVGLIVLGATLPLLSQYYQIFAMRFVLGLGGAWILVTINPIIAELFEGKELVIVNGLNAVAFNAGLAVVLSMAGTIAGDPAKILYIIGLVLIGCGILWQIVGNADPAGEKSKKTSDYTIKDGFKEKFNLIFAVSYSGLLGFYLVAFTFMNPANIKYVIYAGMVGAVAGITFGAKIEDKLRLVRISALLQLLSAIVFLMLFEHPVAKLVGIILGFMIFFPMPSYVTLAYKRKDITQEKISVTFSIFWSVSYAVSIFIVQTFGILTDIAGGTMIPMIFIIGCESIFFFGTAFLFRTESFELKEAEAGC